MPHPGAGAGRLKDMDTDGVLVYNARTRPIVYVLFLLRQALWIGVGASYAIAAKAALPEKEILCVNVILDPDIYSSGTMNQTKYK